MNPFDYVNAISYTKENLIEDPYTEKGYEPFIINRHFSYFLDTVLDANTMNMYPGIGKKLQFDYLINSVRAVKRFTKWHKKLESDSDLNAVMEYYKFNRSKAKSALEILSKVQLENIKKELEKGGIVK
jgi:hypothetical protein